MNKVCIINNHLTEIISLIIKTSDIYDKIKQIVD